MTKIEFKTHWDFCDEDMERIETLVKTFDGKITAIGERQKDGFLNHF